MSDEEARGIALNYYNPFQVRQPLKVVGQMGLTKAGTSLDGEKENGRNATRAWRALKQAFAHKLVAVVPMPRPWIDEELGMRMREAFPNLLGVQVVNLHDLSIKGERERDDKIHEELGHAAAKWIAQGTLFQDGSVIGLGSGRGVYETVRYLQEFPALNARNVRVMSLTGWVHAKSHAGIGGGELEADKHAAMIVQCFRHPTIGTHMVNHPITHEDPYLRARILERTHLGRRQWNEIHPGYALFGVGVLAPGHRLYEEAKATKHEPGLRPILDPLRELVEIGEHVNSISSCCLYYMVADIANQLFCVHGHHWDRIDQKTRLRVEELVQEVNERLLTVSPSQLQDVGNVILVAGTECKATAIRHLLHTEQCNIRFLCTDKKTAMKILSLPF
jgi:DNA-binding transcriptional regulator LsrR (DeoR family)